MALSTNPNLDWFQNINLGNGDTPWDATTTTNSQTPFVNWYMPDNNEPHVTLTQQNVNFALSEIIEDNTLNTEFFDSNFIKVKNNPFNNTLTLLSSSLINNANVSIVDITGKVVYNSQQNINKEAQITLNIASGIYILNIKTNENYTFRTKIIKQ